MVNTTYRVLLIDDDEEDYFLTSELLNEIKGTCYEIEWVSRYSNALDAICSGLHDVCLIDYRLGGGTGIDLVKQAAARNVGVPMILLTGQGDKEVDLEATEAGAADYLVKGEIESALLERSIRYAVRDAQLMETLRESESRFRSVIESAGDAIVVINRDGEIYQWNRSATKIFGYSEAEATGKQFATLFPPRFSEVRVGVNDGLLATSLLNFHGSTQEVYGVRRNGNEFPLEISLSSWYAAGQIFYCGIIRDITERKALEDQLTHQALHDPLTKLPNRVLFRNRLEHALERSHRRQVPVGILFLDLDKFKNINDSLGHAVGDQVLVYVAERISSCLRSGDTAARLSGDEFAVLVEESVRPEDAVTVAERLTKILAPPLEIQGKKITVGASIGIATTSPGRKSNLEDLLRNADVAMYTAKNRGKGQVVVFEDNMHAALIQKIEMEADLQRALEKLEFSLHYQPIIDLHTGQVTGMESLIRWNHPQFGLILPGDFIPVAEESGIILSIGRWVLETACRQAKHWQSAYFENRPFSMTVNVSGRQFQDQGLIDSVRFALESSGLPSACLVLEITESMMLQNTDTTIKKLHELKNLGVRLAIDDFGTGYSALSYLQRFPVDILKIDKSFVEKINQGHEGAAVASAIITMSETLSLSTIAEGIEIDDQRAVLLNLGCEFGQGFHFARPLSAADMDNFLENSGATGRSRPAAFPADTTLNVASRD